MSDITHEQLVALAVAILAAIGGAIILLGQLFKKLGFGRIQDQCPVPELRRECRDELNENIKKTHDKVLVLEQGQMYVKDAIERKRKRIDSMDQKMTEIKTDVKWIVSDMRKRNNKAK